MTHVGGCRSGGIPGLRTFSTRDFRLVSGQALPELTVAYETYGALDADRTNAILVMHGTTSTHVAAGRVTPDLRQGWWDGIIGPGKLFDTDRYFVISSNMLGSSYGTTGPASLDPRTGKPWRGAFPSIAVEDIVNAQKSLIDGLGIKRLFCVAGQSVGGLLAFQWAVCFPDSVRGIVATDCGPVNRFGSAAALPELVGEIQEDAAWNGGDYEPGALEQVMTRIRLRTLQAYNFTEKFEGELPPDQIEALLYETARDWAREFDPMSLVRLNEAVAAFDVSARLESVRARFFYVLCDTDEFYPASIGPEVVDKMASAGTDITFHAISSDLGHYATAAEPEKWVAAAAEFLESMRDRTQCVVHNLKANL